MGTGIAPTTTSSEAESREEKDRAREIGHRVHHARARSRPGRVAQGAVPADALSFTGSPLPWPKLEQLVHEFDFCVPRRERSHRVTPNSSARASSDKNAFGVKRGERRFEFGLGRLPATSPSPRDPTAAAAPPPSLSRSFVRRKERNDGGHQFRFKIVYWGAADAIDGRSHDSLEGHAIIRKKP